MDKKNEESSEYFANIFTDKKDNFSNTLKISFNLYLSIVSFKTIYHHILDDTKDGKKRDFLEKLPDFVTDKWINDQLQQLTEEIEEFKKQSQSTMMGQIFGSMMGKPDQLKEMYEKKIKVIGEAFRKMLKE